ncbi:conserved hypothetical protein [Solidesulfovibrio fructosivorans JJ]]|uniref:FeoB-associated Cys-rich membrane protein n=1 Tax=Solidesulfovibrio fructosivorans JJ] TaxID=596151 RepID=E1JVH7_SOLFR|nr:FeoB-associated Cys-rich membrane protein [Solidesulfovibrio fructosivorans]EFL51771.1 conserved hypothetical protein [Solidesulfovibrio fructosivorans JJ]]
MDKLIVFLIIAVAAGYVIRRFFFKKSGGCGCGCSGCDGGAPIKGEGSCCQDGQKLQ